MALIDKNQLTWGISQLRKMQINQIKFTLCPIKEQIQTHCWRKSTLSLRTITNSRTSQPPYASHYRLLTGHTVTVVTVICDCARFCFLLDKNKAHWSSAIFTKEKIYELTSVAIELSYSKGRKGEIIIAKGQTFCSSPNMSPVLEYTDRNINLSHLQFC